MLHDEDIQKIWEPIDKAIQEMSEAITEFWAANEELFGRVIDLLDEREEREEPPDVADHN